MRPIDVSLGESGCEAGPHLSLVTPARQVFFEELALLTKSSYKRS